MARSAAFYKIMPRGQMHTYCSFCASRTRAGNQRGTDDNFASPIHRLLRSRCRPWCRFAIQGQPRYGRCPRPYCEFEAGQHTWTQFGTGPVQFSSRRTIPSRRLSILPRTHQGSRSSQKMERELCHYLPEVRSNSMAEPVFEPCQLLLDRTHAPAPNDSREYVSKLSMTL